jgi:hypothetical protein
LGGFFARRSGDRSAVFADSGGEWRRMAPTNGLPYV